MLAMSQNTHLLTFAWEPCTTATLCATGYRWDVVPRRWVDRTAPWDLSRQLPANAQVIRSSAALQGLTDRTYALAICHTPREVEAVAAAGIPSLLVVRGLPGTPECFGVDRETLAELLQPRTGGKNSVTPVYISNEHRSAWGFEGVVIPLGVDLEAHGPYNGVEPRVLVVEPPIETLPVATGSTLLDQVTAGLPTARMPSISMGPGPTVQAVRGSDYARYRVFFDARPHRESAAPPLSLLRAMASGQPVVTTAEPRPFLVNGQHGYIDTDPWRLRQHLLRLLADRDTAAKLGQNGRASVSRHFPVVRSTRAWRKAIDQLLFETHSNQVA